ncbi:hypothetical protein M758_UG288600 [Ceratodon purpureus]|nr:hypothetical protein M758_UG288600 [Ceratodon purpureus]
MITSTQPYYDTACRSSRRSIKSQQRRNHHPAHQRRTPTQRQDTIITITPSSSIIKPLPSHPPINEFRIPNFNTTAKTHTTRSAPLSAISPQKWTPQNGTATSHSLPLLFHHAACAQHPPPATSPTDARA